MATLLEIASVTDTVAIANMDFSLYGPVWDGAQTFTVPAGKVWTLTGFGAYVTLIPTASTWSCKFSLCGTSGGEPDLSNILSEFVVSDSAHYDVNTYWTSTSLRVLTEGVYAVVVWGMTPLAEFPERNQLTLGGSGVGGLYSGGTAWNRYSGGSGDWEPEASSVDAAIIITGTESDAPFTPPVGGPTKKRLIACANDKFWYEGI